MKIFKLFLTSIMMATAVAFTSCNSLDNPEQMKQTVTLDLGTESIFSAVLDTQSDSQNWTVSRGVSAQLVYELVSSSLEFTVNNLTLGEKGSQPISFNVTGLTFKGNEDGSAVTSASVALGYIGDQTNNNYVTLTGINVYTLLHQKLIFNGYSQRTVFLSFTVDNRYQVQLIMFNTHYFGTTISAPIPGAEVLYPGASDTFTSTAPKYRVAFASDLQSVTLDIDGARFSSAMPTAFYMRFPGLKYTITSNGVVFNCEQLSPQIINNPGSAIETATDYPKFAITDLNASAMFTGTLSLEFNCAASWHVDVQASVVPLSE